MGKFNISNIAKSVGMAMKKNSPEILTGIGIAGMITTVIMAVRATPKALQLIEVQSYDEERGAFMSLTKLEIVKITWPCYVPAAVTGCLSVICLIGASSVNAQRNAALATVYALSESRLKEYQEKVIETIGEKKEQSIRDTIAQDKIDKNPVSSREVYITDKGNTLCFDVISGRYFKIDIDKLKRVAIDLSRTMLNDMYVSLNDFYYEIGLPNISLGDELGWHISDGSIDLQFSSRLADDGETPCLVLNYMVAPRYDYTKR